MSGAQGNWRTGTPLIDIVNKSAATALTSLKGGYGPALLQTLPAGGTAPMDAITRDLLLSALIAVKDKAPNDSKHPPLTPPLMQMVGGVASVFVPSTTGGSGANVAVPIFKVSDFNAKTNAQQRAFIDEIWKRLVDYRIPTTKAEAMVEHDGPAEEAWTPLPSSLAPSEPDAANVTLIRRDNRKIWQQYRIGFRVEGSRSATADDMTRIRQRGPSPLLHNRALMRSLRGWCADDTYVEQRDRIFLWWGNEDVLNESATCVSRSLFGATALPKRDFDTAANGLQFHYLLAIDCSGHIGADSEAWQQARGAASVWRPGEKAFLTLDQHHVIGWTRLLKEAPPGGKGGWRFRLPDNSWNWIKMPSKEVQDYLTLELRAWRANRWYNVSGAYDFAGST